MADPGGLTATATVTVTVTPVNDPPDAVDDEAGTLEDEALVIDVLANDTDPDGDPLRIVSATAPAHGTATPGAGGVRYAPALNYHGQDSFDYTIADPGGLTDTATVTVTVLPVNDAPEAVGVIPDQPLEEGGEPVTLDLALYFTDVDGDVGDVYGGVVQSRGDRGDGERLDADAVGRGAGRRHGDGDGPGRADRDAGVRRVGRRSPRAGSADGHAGRAGAGAPFELAADRRPATGNRRHR